ncbi:hypothetical protein O6H91_08G039000 [Diphasiastrum complanatum]|uniref:Uncharacterized protein n=1 Tax=Diphasiastrum complanatum TaxID=34168 RepID=A0ACC2CWP7_DIPCM|nr:hypothetical protein O6H91_08G039000 [Diphasiastrum complanatum]
MVLKTMDLWSPSRLKTMAVLFALGLGVYLVGPPLYWEIVQGGSSAQVLSPCPPCVCDCSTLDLANEATAGCVTISKETNDSEQKKTELIVEEIKLQKYVFEESQQTADLALLEVKKLSSQYQKEAEKCNIGIQTSEDAREKAETTLELQIKQAMVWENRARLLGWNDSKFTIMNINMNNTMPS